MANKDHARGLWPLRHKSGGEIQTEEFVLTTGATIYQGDLVSLAAAGTVTASTAGAGVAAIGVSSEYVSDSGSAGGKKILIYTDPNIIFGIQQASGGSIAVADRGLSADHVAGSGSSTTKLSGHELSGTVATTAAQFHILNKMSTPNNAWGEHANLEVIFNEHRYKSAGTAGV